MFEEFKLQWKFPFSTAVLFASIVKILQSVPHVSQFFVRHGKHVQHKAVQVRDQNTTKDNWSKLIGVFHDSWHVARLHPSAWNVPAPEPTSVANQLFTRSHLRNRLGTMVPNPRGAPRGFATQNLRDAQRNQINIRYKRGQYAPYLDNFWAFRWLAVRVHFLKKKQQLRNIWRNPIGSATVLKVHVWLEVFLCAITLNATQTDN